MNSANTISKRIFCIGMNKTGTSTMKHCFETLRLTPIASPKGYSSEIREQIHRFYKHKNYSEMLDLAEHYRAFEDRPWNMWSMYRQLHERFPDSLFILTVRDPESWWRSVERWITVTKPEVLERYQLHLRVHQISKESMIESYLRYNNEVKSYFKATDRLLTINFEEGDGWVKLCAFLELPVPDVEFPHANQQKYTPADAEKLKAKRQLKHGIECQACHHLTIVKKPRGRGSKNGGKVSFLPTLLQKLIPNKVRRITPEKLQNLIAVRKALYGTHRTLRTLQAPFRSSSADMQRRPSPDLEAKELAVVSCFFNPGGSTKRVANFNTFLAGMRESGVRCLVVELAFGLNPFQIIDHDDVVQLRTDDILWHKERLLNIGIKQLLAAGFRKIAWLDGDIVFEDPNWPAVISDALETHKLCQVFDTIRIRAHDTGPPMLAPSSVKYFDESDQLYSQTPIKLRNVLRGYLKGGQSGFGWAARAEVLEQVLLFENAIVGGGDKLMLAASLADDLTDSRLTSLTRSKVACTACGHRNRSRAYTENYLDWARRWSKVVDKSVGYARLDISDMYHGQRSDRGYLTRHDILYRHDFDPHTDLEAGESGCLDWTGNKGLLQREVEAYFLSRREDV